MLVSFIPPWDDLYLACVVSAFHPWDDNITYSGVVHPTKFPFMVLVDTVYAYDNIMIRTSVIIETNNTIV